MSPSRRAYRCAASSPTREADFQYNGLAPPDAILLASDLSLTSVSGVLTRLNLSNNALCGLDDRGRGTYSAEGIKAIADALRVNGALTSLNLERNKIGPEGGKAISEALRVNGALTSLNVGNPLGDEAKAALREIAKGRPSLALNL